MPYQSPSLVPPSKRCVLQEHPSQLNNIALVPPPPKCPELNLAENIWQFMRDNWLSNRVFRCYDNIVDHCCHAWNRLVEQLWTIMSIGLRDWAHQF
jgi:transposase